LKKFGKGFGQAALYYAVGFSIAGLAHLIIGQGYIHGPGVIHVIGFLVILGGAFLLIRNLIHYYTGRIDELNFGSIVMHLLIIGGFTLFIGIMIYKVKNPDSTIEAKSNFRIINSNGDTSLVLNEFGDTLFLKIGDSVLLDK
jgi:membrane-bound ClpP family serine protease